MQKSKFFKFNLYFFILFVAIVAIDLITKSIAFHYNWKDIILIPNVLGIHVTMLNTGSAWSFLGNWQYSNLFLTIVTAVLLVILLALIYFLPKEKKLIRYGLVCILAGGVGNIIDRIFLQGVRDFITVPVFGFICNIADIAVTVGAILFILALLFFDKDALFISKKKKAEKEKENE